MALAGELAKYIGNELVKTGGKELAKAGAKSALSSLVPSVATKVGTDLATKAGDSALRKLLVNQATSVAEKIPVAVGDAGKISLYRGMHADSPANLQKYIEDMKNPNIVPRTYTGNAFAGDGYHFYDNIEGAREYALDGMNLGEPYSAVVKIDVPKNRFIGINSQNGNDAESFIGRALERGAKNAPEVGNKNFRDYIQRNGILGSHNTGPFGDSSQYVVMNNEATAGLEAIENYENGKLMEDIATSGADKYLPKAPTQIKFNKDLSIRKTGGNFGHKGVKGMRGGSAPKVQQSLDDSSITLYHGTPNKFEDFDESLPSVWFSDSDKNLRDTGLSIKGGQSMNVMERQLPKDLKIADEDLADRLTKQQLQDRGYAGIAYTERGPNRDETYYEIFRPYYNQSLEKIPEVQQYISSGGYGQLANDAKKIGSAEVAPIDPETLPGAYDKMRDYLADYKNAVPKAIGKPASKITKADLVSLLEDYGYDTDGNKYELWNTAQDMLEDQLIDELYEENGEVFARFLGDHRGGAGITKPGAFRLGSGNRANYLDSVYSDRLGIGRSHTPMADSLNKYNRYGMDTAGGDYMTNGIGINLNSWGNEGEGGVSTIAHERMHAWQDQGKGWNYDERFRDAYEELRKDLEPYFHDREQILKDHPNSNRELDYWARENEQEARMLQSYLENEGFTKTGRKPEWGNEIKPAFDKFYKKLRELSKAGVALPAIALAFGLSTNSDDKKLDNIE